MPFSMFRRLRDRKTQSWDMPAASCHASTMLCTAPALPLCELTSALRCESVAVCRLALRAVYSRLV